MKFNLRQALDYYHKAHFLNSADTLAEELINRAMEHLTRTDLFPIENTVLPLSH